MPKTTLKIDTFCWSGSYACTCKNFVAVSVGINSSFILLSSMGFTSHREQQNKTKLLSSKEMKALKLVYKSPLRSYKHTSWFWHSDLAYPKYPFTNAQVVYLQMPRGSLSTLTSVKAHPNFFIFLKFTSLDEPSFDHKEKFWTSLKNLKF